MNNIRLYDEIAINFPPTWPIDHKLEWILIHDGNHLKVNDIQALLEKYINTSEGYVVVHSDPGIAKKIKLEQAIETISEHVLNEEIQIADSKFTSFVLILKIGVAAGCKY